MIACFFFSSSSLPSLPSSLSLSDPDDPDADDESSLVCGLRVLSTAGCFIRTLCDLIGSRSSAFSYGMYVTLSKDLLIIAIY